MNNRIQLLKQPILPINQNTSEAVKSKVEKTDKTFKELLDELYITKQIKISKHAQQRIMSRNIKLTSNDFEKINKAVNKAMEKGVKDSLILMDKVALVVSVKNRTVITAVDEKNLKENVFTNIDGAVII